MKQKELLRDLKRDANLDDVQTYIKNVNKERPFGDEPIEQSLLILMEEVGELAKAVRKDKTNIPVDREKLHNYDSVEHEVADVFVVLLSICNRLDINLFDAFVDKEKINVNRTWDNE
jgi:NTP pyrophosphatase (non-canonical NTP hydrolase)